jgi:hypothetical protein
MAYKLQTEVGWEDGYFRKYYCETATDLASLPTSPTIAIGSIAELENGTTYKLSNANTWKLFSSVTGALIGSGKSSASVTRPADESAYAANDVIATATANFTFANVLPVAQQFIITGVSLRIDAAAIPAGLQGFKLHLYDTIPTVIADNVAYNLPAADRAKYLGYIQLAAPVDNGDTLWSQNDNINLNGKLVTTSLYGILTTDNAFTPSSACVKTITLYTIGV